MLKKLFISCVKCKDTNEEKMQSQKEYKVIENHHLNFSFGPEFQDQNDEGTNKIPYEVNK
jgi:hypothetical protein